MIMSQHLYAMDLEYFEILINSFALELIVLSSVANKGSYAANIKSD